MCARACVRACVHVFVRAHACVFVFVWCRNALGERGRRDEGVGIYRTGRVVQEFIERKHEGSGRVVAISLERPDCAL